jgi:hypothetical protein
MNAEDARVSVYEVYVAHEKKTECFIHGYCYVCNTGDQSLG